MGGNHPADGWAQLGEMRSFPAESYNPRLVGYESMKTSNASRVDGKGSAAREPDCVNFGQYTEARSQCFQCFRAYKPACKIETQRRINAQLRQPATPPEVIERQRRETLELFSDLDATAQALLGVPWRALTIPERLQVMEYRTAQRLGPDRKSAAAGK